MKIVFISKDRLTGYIKLTKFELMIFVNALSNFERSVPKEEYEIIIHANAIDIERLQRDAWRLFKAIDADWKKIENLQLVLDLYSVDKESKIIQLTVSRLVARAFYKSVTCLKLPLTDNDRFFTNLLLAQVKPIEEKLKKIYDQIPWEIEYPVVKYSVESSHKKITIVSLDEDKYSGTIEIAKATLLIFARAFDNFECRFADEDIEKVLGANTSEVKELKLTLNSLISQMRFPQNPELQNRAGQTMEIISLDYGGNLILLKISNLEARAMFSALAWLNVTMEEMGAVTIAGLQRFMFDQVAVKLKQICASIPWED